MCERSLWINCDGEVVHPNAPAGGGGPGFFASAPPLGKDPNLDPPVPHPFSPAGNNLVPNEQQKQQLSGGDTPDVPDALTIKPTSPVPDDILADTVDDFVSKSNAARGGDEVAHMQATLDGFEYESDSRRRITKVKMAVSTQIVRPRWAGGRVSDSERALIEKAQTLIKEHEERHRDIAKDFVTRAFNDLHGKPVSKAQAIYDEWMKKLDAAQDELDSREGLLIVEHNGPNGNAGPATGVKLGPRPKSKKP
ncbi:MAG: DUF922 domain-containing protein [Thermoguttaceae bacterium]